MDRRHLNQMAKAFAASGSRRATLKTIAAALGVSAVGALGQSRTTMAQTTNWCGCYYTNGTRTRVRCID
jgi:hypothetical protein